MSRRYCADCGAKHDNGGLGFCDSCAERHTQEEVTQQTEEDAEFAAFMELSEDDRWRVVFESIRRISHRGR